MTKESTKEAAPNGYYKQLPSEAITIIEAFMQRENIPVVARYNIAQTLKYLCRCGLKPSSTWKEDTLKALNYLNRALYGTWGE